MESLPRDDRPVFAIHLYTGSHSPANPNGFGFSWHIDPESAAAALITRGLSLGYERFLWFLPGGHYMPDLEGRHPLPMPAEQWIRMTDWQRKVFGITSRLLLGMGKRNGVYTGYSADDAAFAPFSGYADEWWIDAAAGSQEKVDSTLELARQMAEGGVRVVGEAWPVTPAGGKRDLLAEAWACDWFATADFWPLASGHLTDDLNRPRQARPRLYVAPTRGPVSMAEALRLARGGEITPVAFHAWAETISLTFNEGMNR